MKLTTKNVELLTLPPGKSDALFFDDDVPGLALRVRVSGSRTWVFQYRHNRFSQRRIALGAVSALPLGEARRRAAKLHAEVKLGGDPAGAKAKARLQATQTFGVVLPSYLASRRAILRPKSFVEVRRDLEVHARTLHGMPFTVDPLEARRAIATVLANVAASLSNRSANKLRSSLSGFYAWAAAQGLIDINPAAHTEMRPQVSRDRLLTDGEVREIWSALGDGIYGDIMRLLLFTGTRASEIGALRWSEVDFGQALITLPAERVKIARPRHIVLAEPALAILRKRWNNRFSDMVFATVPRGFSDWAGSKRDLDARIKAARRSAAVAAGDDPDKVEALPGWVVHDFRRLASTTMHERLAIAPHVVEACLGHVGHQRGVAGVYNLAIYLNEMRRTLEIWCDHLLAITKGRPAKVVALRA
jgi:integrase